MRSKHKVRRLDTSHIMLIYLQLISRCYNLADKKHQGKEKKILLRWNLIPVKWFLIRHNICILSHIPSDRCQLAEKDVAHVGRGVFGAEMRVSLVNDGPFTICLDTDELARPR